MNPTWQERFSKLADMVSGWSKDPSTKVGAVIVAPNKTIVSVGFNGAPAGFDDDWVLETRERKLLYTMHAEANAIWFSDKSKLAGSSIFVTHPPCKDCADKIIDAGILEVYYTSPDQKFFQRWNSEEVLDKLKKAGVTCNYLPTAESENEH